MSRPIAAQPLTHENFAPFGDVIDTSGGLHYPINGGKTELLSAEEAGNMGFKIVLYSTPALYAAVFALARELRTLAQTHDLRSISRSSMTFGQFQRLVEDRYARHTNSVPPPVGDE